MTTPPSDISFAERGCWKPPDLTTLRGHAYRENGTELPA
jgi:hypothetical protein